SRLARNGLNSEAEGIQAVGSRRNVFVVFKRGTTIRRQPMSAFTFTGEFAGFIRLANGKRRLVLCALSQEMMFKVPREMREELEGMLIRGGTITVHGVEEHEGEHHEFVVSAL